VESNDGARTGVQNADAALGYVELRFAETPVVLRDTDQQAGKPCARFLEGVVEAAKNSITEFPEDMRVSITDAPGDASYPISALRTPRLPGLSYLKKGTSERPADVHQLCVNDGQEMASRLCRSRPKCREVEKMKTIVFDGQRS